MEFYQFGVRAGSRGLNEVMDLGSAGLGRCASTGPEFGMTSPLAASVAAGFRLYRLQWENPLPNVAVESVDLVSAKSDCSLVLIALTTEP